MSISSGKKDEAGGGDVFVGTVFAIAKVLISCLGAVITDKYMKKYSSDPTHVCIARTFVARALFIVLLSFTQRASKDENAPFLWAEGFSSFSKGANWMAA